MRNYIMDTSSLFYSLPELQENQEKPAWIDVESWRIVITEKIKEEIRDIESRIFLRISTPKISVLPPKEQYIKEVKEESGKSGELSKLSEADISLLALALQFSREESGRVIVVTEDYAIQNYCSLYGLPFKSLRNRRISEERIVMKRCKGCGLHYPVKFSECPSCGSKQYKEGKEKAKKLPSSSGDT